MLSDLELIWFFRQIQYLLNSGLSLYPSILIIYSDCEDSKIKKILSKVVVCLKEGDSFSAVINEQMGTGVFVTNIIKVGEHKGSLDNALIKVIEYLERKIELKRKLINALSYPVLLFLLSVGILFWVNIQIIPNFQEVYSQAGLSLPLPTRILFYANKVFIEYWLFLLILILVGLSFFILVYRKKMRLIISKIKFFLPILGRIYYFFTILSFFSNFGTLQQSGITVIKSLRLSIDSVNNLFLRSKLEVVYEKVLEGMKVSKALEITGFFPNMVIQMLATGEESSALGDVCLKVSEHLDQEMDIRINRLIGLIGPVSLIIVGIFVAFISMSFLLPLFRMTSVIHA